jgi:flagellar motor switch protein FliN
MADQFPIPAGNSPTVLAPAAEYVRIWSESIAFVLGQIAGKPFATEQAEETPPDCPPAVETDHRMVAVSSGSLRGELGLRIPRRSTVEIAQILVGEAPNGNAEFKPEHQEAFEEFLRQTAGHVVSALKPVWGEVQIRLDSAAPPAWSAAATRWIFTASEAPCRLWIECQISAALQASLVAAGRSADGPVRQAASIAGGQHPGVMVPGTAGNLDLLMDVELGVTLRFGSRNMQLQDILELGAGAVVELDRGIEEPAELLLEGKVIARGEVVVVDGNYGLRVLDIVTLPAEGDQSQGSGR